MSADIQNKQEVNLFFFLLMHSSERLWNGEQWAANTTGAGKETRSHSVDLGSGVYPQTCVANQTPVHFRSIATCFSWHEALTQYAAAEAQRCTYYFERDKETTASFTSSHSPFRKIYSLLWILLRGKGRNKHIFTFPHSREKGCI